MTIYSYDLYGRLISETAGKEKKNYTYDLSGNSTRLAVSGNQNYNTYYKYDAYNRLTKETKNEKGKAKRDDNNYYYDFNGNLTLVTYDDIGYNHSSSEDGQFKISNELELAGSYEKRQYNGFNELTFVFCDNHPNANWVYRPDGLMFKNDQSYYAWQGGNIIAETNAGGKEKYYTRGQGLIKSSDGLYYLPNGHRDISALAKENGTVKTQYTYDAFGNSSSKGEYSDNPFKYCGEYEDYSLGGIYLRARIYNPETGRFTTEDTYWNINNMIYGDENNGIPDISAINQSGNLYVYAMNNPIKYIDPTGNRSQEEADKIIKANKQYIKNAAQKFQVNPYILAATIYAEQRLNVDWVDDLTD